MDGYLRLDSTREAEYLPILERLKEDLSPADYGYDPISGEFWNPTTVGPKGPAAPLTESKKP